LTGKRTGKRTGSERWWPLLAAVALVAAGCRQDMHDQPKIEPLEASAFFADGQGARPIPAGTVPRGQLREDDHRWTGKDAAGDFVDALPAGMELDRELLEHGRTRYEIFCSPCHDSTGGGLGMIVRRGFKQPPPLSEARLQGMPAGYFYDVITQGFGQMSSYAKQIPVDDRWAIVAYVRALQLSQNARLASLPEGFEADFRHALEEQAAEEEHGSEGAGDDAGGH